MRHIFLFLILFLYLLISSHASSYKITEDLILEPDTLVHYDTLLIKDNYIVLGDKNCKIDLILDNSIKTKSKGDTLYNNYDTFSPCLLLGDKEYQNKISLLKKYSPKYEFSQYKVDNIYKGTFAKPDFNSNPKWKRYKTKIIESAKGKPTFAGHYWICGWRCGSSCQTFVVVDCITGKIFDGIDGIELEENKISNLWESYSDSRMLIVNNNTLEKGKYYDLLGDCYLCGNTEVYIFENNKFKRVE